MTARRSAIVDLDGTLIDLHVDWALLRQELDVRSIRELWSKDDLADWHRVSTAEFGAATSSELNQDLVAILQSADHVAVLSNNSVRAIGETLRRIGGRADTWMMIGREDLGSPKEHRSTFRGAVRQVVHAWQTTPQEVWYIGDSPYEIEYARELGMRTWHISSWSDSQIPEGF